MLDQCAGPGARPARVGRGGAGTFPIVAFRVGGQATWGTEAVMLSAGTASSGCATTSGSSRPPEESEAVAAQCETSGDVWFVPALLGLGTPVWDFGARGTLVGLTRGSGRPEMVRAVLEGVAHRGADLVEASEADSGFPIASLRIDGGMSDNAVFVAGAGRRHRASGRDLAGPGGDHARCRPPGRAGRRHLRLDRGAGRHVLAPPCRRTRRATTPPGRRPRERWLAARGKAEGTIPELSGISF